MKNILIIIFFIVSFNAYAENSNQVTALKNKLEVCLKDADTLAKSYADLKKSEVINTLEKSSLVKGGASGAGCVVLSAMVGFSDLGGLAALCTGVATVVGGISYLSNSKEINETADKIFTEAFKSKSAELRDQCISEFTEKL
jgi:hypothetical protein